MDIIAHNTPDWQHAVIADIERRGLWHHTRISAQGHVLAWNGACPYDGWAFRTPAAYQQLMAQYDHAEANARTIARVPTTVLPTGRARRWLIRWARRGVEIRAYRCPEGAWHLWVNTREYPVDEFLARQEDFYALF